MNVADTDVLIDYLRGRDPGASWIERHLATGASLRTTVISRFELLAGARTDEEREVVETLLAAVPSLPLDDDSADRAAKVRSRLEQEGVGIGMGDSLIAGIVLTAGGTLVTRNLRHFRRVPDLRSSSPENA